MFEMKKSRVLLTNHIKKVLIFLFSIFWFLFLSFFLLFLCTLFLFVLFQNWKFSDFWPNQLVAYYGKNEYPEHQYYSILSRKGRLSANNTVPQVPCEKCGRRYTTRSIMLRHRNHECGLEKNIPCQLCGKKFRRKWNLDQHYKRVHKMR